MSLILSPETLSDLNRVAKSSIEHYFKHQRALYGNPAWFAEINSELSSAAKTVYCSLSMPGGANRGCRGVLANEKQGGTLFDSVRLSAVASAFEDKRFSPCSEWLVPSLNVQCYVLDTEAREQLTTADTDELAKFTSRNEGCAIAMFDSGSGRKLSLYVPTMFSALRGKIEYVQKLAAKAKVKYQPGYHQVTLAAYNSMYAPSQKFSEIKSINLLEG